MRAVAAAFGVSVGAVAYWVAQARGRRLDRMSFANDKPGRPWNRISAKLEQRILRVRASLREHSVLGEYGPDAIGLALREQNAHAPVPGRATIARVLVRRGVLDGVHRQRRPAPPKGWYLPEVAAGDAELDSFDFIEDLKIATGPLVSVPYTLELNDIPMMLIQHHESTAWLDRVRDQFDRLYLEGTRNPRVMAIAVHPYIHGVPHRIKYFEAVYDYIRRKKGVWMTTGEEIYEWFKRGR